jgi:hypothetical protein
VGYIPGVKVSLPSTIIAPAGGVVRTQGGVVEVDAAAELLVEVEVLVVDVVDVVDDEVEVGAAEEVLVGDTDEVVLVGAAEDVVDDWVVVDVAVLIQEQALETLDGRFEQADAQAGSVAEAGPVV